MEVWQSLRRLLGARLYWRLLRRLLWMPHRMILLWGLHRRLHRRARWQLLCLKKIRWSSLNFLEIMNCCITRDSWTVKIKIRGKPYGINSGLRWTRLPIRVGSWTRGQWMARLHRWNQIRVHLTSQISKIGLEEIWVSQHPHCVSSFLRVPSSQPVKSQFQGHQCWPNRRVRSTLSRRAWFWIDANPAAASTTANISTPTHAKCTSHPASDAYAHATDVPARSTVFWTTPVSFLPQMAGALTFLLYGTTLRWTL